MGLPIQHAERWTSLLSLSGSTDKRVHSCHRHRLKSAKTRGTPSRWWHVRCRFYQESKRRGERVNWKCWRQCWRTTTKKDMQYVVDWPTKLIQKLIGVSQALGPVWRHWMKSHIKWAVTVKSVLTQKQHPRQRSLSWLGLLSGPKSSFHIKVKFVRCFPCYLKVLIHSPLIRLMFHYKEPWCILSL